MPLYHKPRTFTPLLIAAEKKAVKNGLHHSIFTSRLDRYVGDWKKDLKEGAEIIAIRLRIDGRVSANWGKGSFFTITGKLYEGDWYKGFRHGFGALSNHQPNGTYSLEYRGDWVRGKPEGMGWRYYQNGDVYFGFWRRGQRHGYGKMWYKDGTLYIGYWNMSKREGLGMYVQANGNRYEGNWEGDIKHGLGRFYHMHTGQLQEGCWVNDICVKSKMSDILVRQFCDLPTRYPVPPENLQQSRKLLEESEFWLKQEIGDIDKQLRYCIDQMY